jgi:drug/metabolite transporter (DMT)-like permease
MMGLRQHRLGLILVVVSAMAWSTAGLFTRLADMDSATILVWRGAFSAIGIQTFMLLLDGKAAWNGYRRMGRAGWLFAIVSALGMLCFIAALNLTTVAHVSILYATVPFMAAGLGYLVLGERIGLGVIAASSAALFGVIVMTGFGARQGSLIGDVLALAMTFSMAVMMVISRRNRDIPILPAACLSAALSALMALPFSDFAGITAQQFAVLALFGLANSAIGLGLFTLGARHLPAAETALIGALETPLAPLWVWLAFNETPNTQGMIGGTIVFAAVFGFILRDVGLPFLVRSRPAQEP